MEESLIKELVANNQDLLLVERKISEQISTFENEVKQLREKEVQLKSAIKQAMEKNNIKKFENDLVSIIYIAETQRRSLDTAKLKENEPETYEKYSKISKVSSSVRLTIKKTKVAVETINL